VVSVPKAAASSVSVDVFLQENLTQQGMRLIVLAHDRRAKRGTSIGGGGSASSFGLSFGLKVRRSTAKATTSNIIAKNPGLWRRVQNEVHELICGSSKRYASIRNGFGQLTSPRSQTGIVSTMAVAIALHLGVAAGLIVPLVALVLSVFLNVGKNAYCSGATPPKKKRATKKLAHRKSAA
jgi:hypothetical protein